MKRPACGDALRESVSEGAPRWKHTKENNRRARAGTTLGVQLAADVLASGRLLRDAAYETLWPARCAVCDLPGAVLCERCRLSLPYLDRLRACPVCGAANGINACCECNRFILDWKGLESFPLDGCASATLLTPETRRIVLIYKDRGERALAPVIASMLADALPRPWRDAALIPIPPRPRALRERGFDHMGLISRELSARTGMPQRALLVAEARRDQRALDARARLANMSGSLHLAQSDLRAPQRVVLVDDVFTTGATLFAAAEALRKAGAAQVYGLTFARV